LNVYVALTSHACVGVFAFDLIIAVLIMVFFKYVKGAITSKNNSRVVSIHSIKRVCKNKLKIHGLTKDNDGLKQT
jgi:hypothetical protein